MSIDATEPTVISASYDKWAFSFYTSGFPCAAPGGSVADTVSAHATLVKFRIRDDGVYERSPLPADIREVHIEDIYATAATKPSVAAALAALLVAVAEIAADQGAL